MSPRPMPAHAALDELLTKKYVESFRTHIEAPDPLIMPTTLNGIMASYHKTNGIYDPAQLSRSEETVALLVLALGAFCLNDPDEHGRTYVTRARSLMPEHQDGQGSLDYVWANMLMAVYENLFRVQGDSRPFLARASESLVHLVNLKLPTLQTGDGPFTREQNDMLFACWNFMLGPSNPEGVLSVNLPLPTATVAIDQGLPEHVVRDLLRRIALHCQKSQTQAAVKLNVRSALDRFDVDLREFPAEDLRIAQAPITRMSILDARFKLLYWHTQVVLYEPFLNKFCKNDPELEELQGIARVDDD